MASYRIESLGPGTEVPRFGSWGYPWDSKKEEKEESLYQLEKESRHARTHLNINFKWNRLGCNNKKGMNLDEENMRCQPINLGSVAIQGARCGIDERRPQV